MTAPVNDKQHPTHPEPIFGNVLSMFENGVQLDLRMKLAIQFLNGGVFAKAMGAPDGVDVQTIAENAIDLATEVVRVGLERGFIKDLPEDDNLNVPMMKHLRRNVRAQVVTQQAGQEIQREMDSGVQRLAAGVPPGLKM
jgi:hypothetical protein